MPDHDDALEAIARAICHAGEMCECKSPADCQHPTEFLDCARAARLAVLQGLKGPSAAMVKAADECPPDHADDHALAKYLNARRRFDAMIDAAIAEVEAEGG